MQSARTNNTRIPTSLLDTVILHLYRRVFLALLFCYLAITFNMAWFTTTKAHYLFVLNVLVLTTVRVHFFQWGLGGSTLSFVLLNGGGRRDDPVLGILFGLLLCHLGITCLLTRVNCNNK